MRELATIGGKQTDSPALSYLHGRLTHQVLPMLRIDEIWRHPLVAGAFDADLRDRLLDPICSAAPENEWDKPTQLR